MPKVELSSLVPLNSLDSECVPVEVSHQGENGSIYSGYYDPWSGSSAGYAQPQFTTGQWSPDPPKASSGAKYDSQKPDFSLIDPFAQEGLAKVLTFGKIKYGAYNWLKGIAYSRLIAATERHLNAIKKGEDTDPESGLPHVDHIACNIMFLSRFMKTNPQMDDRPEENKEGKVMF